MRISKSAIRKEDLAATIAYAQYRLAWLAQEFNLDGDGIQEAPGTTNRSDSVSAVKQEKEDVVQPSLHSSDDKRRGSKIKDAIAFSLLTAIGRRLNVNNSLLLQLFASLGLKIDRGSLTTKLGWLRTSGFIEWKDPADIKITDVGRAALRELREKVLTSAEIAAIDAAVEKLLKIQ